MPPQTITISTENFIRLSAKKTDKMPTMEEMDHQLRLLGVDVDAMNQSVSKAYDELGEFQMFVEITEKGHFTFKAKSVERICASCKEKDEKDELFKCSRCATVGRVVLYCSKQCQREDWKEHKVKCGKLVYEV
jgi:hypothetical protein